MLSDCDLNPLAFEMFDDFLAPFLTFATSISLSIEIVYFARSGANWIILMVLYVEAKENVVRYSRAVIHGLCRGFGLLGPVIPILQPLACISIYYKHQY